MAGNSQKIAGAYSTIEIEAKTVGIDKMQAELDQLRQRVAAADNYITSMMSKVDKSDDLFRALAEAFQQSNADVRTLTTSLNRAQNQIAQMNQAAQNSPSVFGRSLNGILNFTNRASGALNNAATAVQNYFKMWETAGSKAVGVVTGVIGDLFKMARQARDFSNATGAESTQSPALFLANFAVGVEDLNQLFNNTSISVALQQIQNQSLLAAEAQKRYNDALGDAQRTLDRLNADVMAEIAEATEDAAQAADRLRINQERASQDYQKSVTREAADFARDTLEAQRDANDRLEELQRSSGYRIIDLERELNDRKTTYQEDYLAEVNDLTKRLLDIEQEYFKKRESLYSRYFDADPFLRPFIQDQIDALGQQEDLERANARTSFDDKKADMERDIALLEEKIRRENEARADQESDIRVSLARREEDLKRSYERSTEDAKLSYDREVADFKRSQQEIDDSLAERLAKAKERLTRAQIDAQERVESATQKITEEVDIRPVVLALKEVGLTLEEAGALMKDSPSKFFEVFADNFAKLDDGAKKTKIIADLFGFFGLQVRPLIDYLGELGPTGRKALEDMLKSLGLVATDYKSILEGQIQWNILMMILKDLAFSVLIPLIPKFIELAKVAQDWYASGGAEDAKTTFGKVTDFIIEKANAVIKFLKGEGTLADVFASGDASTALQGEIDKLLLIVKEGASKLIDELFDIKSMEDAGTKFGTAFGNAFGTAVKDQLKSTILQGFLKDYNYEEVVQNEGSFAAGLGEVGGSAQRNMLRQLGLIPDAKDVEVTVQRVEEAGRAYGVIEKIVKDASGTVIERTKIWKDENTGQLKSVTDRYDETGRKIQTVLNAVQNERAGAINGLTSLLDNINRLERDRNSGSVQLYTAEKQKLEDAMTAPYKGAQDKFASFWDVSAQTMKDGYQAQLDILLDKKNQEIVKENSPVALMLAQLAAFDFKVAKTFGELFGESVISGLVDYITNYGREGLFTGLQQLLTNPFGAAFSRGINQQSGAVNNMYGDVVVNESQNGQSIIGWFESFFGGGR